jgi:hypothetical protein
MAASLLLPLLHSAAKQATPGGGPVQQEDELDGDLEEMQVHMHYTCWCNSVLPWSMCTAFCALTGVFVPVCQHTSSMQA